MDFTAEQTGISGQFISYTSSSPKIKGKIHSVVGPEKKKWFS